MAAMTAMPAHTHVLARFPLRHTGAHGIHDADDFMARHTRILQARPVAFLHQRIAVADATSLNFDAHPAGDGLGNFTLDNFKRFVRSGDLRGTYPRHNQAGLPLFTIGLNFQKIKCLLLTKRNTRFLLT